jgi:uncharacterized protein YndB with AHSA1/START domain
MGTTIGVLHVRRSILIQATPARVWQEFTTPERIRNWLNLGHTVHEFEPRVGGRVEMSVEIGADRRDFGGEVLVFAAEREVTFAIQWRPPHEWPVPTFWTIRLTPLYDGTHVELFHHGFERLGAEAADILEGYEDAWDARHLKALRAAVAGRG